MKKIYQKLRAKPEARLMAGLAAASVIAVAVSVGHGDLDIVALSAVFR